MRLVAKYILPGLILLPGLFLLIMSMGYRIVKKQAVYRSATEFVSSNQILSDRIGTLRRVDLRFWNGWDIDEKKLPCTAALRLTVR
jgi:hypothetical protein